MKKKKFTNYHKEDGLFKFENETVELKARVGRKGFTNFLGGGLTGATLLLKDLVRYNDGLPVAQHVWCKIKEIINADKFKFRAGDVIVLSGVPYRYVGNYRGRLQEKYSLGDIEIKRIIPRETLAV